MRTQVVLERLGSRLTPYYEKGYSLIQKVYAHYYEKYRPYYEKCTPQCQNQSSNEAWFHWYEKNHVYSCACVYIK